MTTSDNARVPPSSSQDPLSFVEVEDASDNDAQAEVSQNETEQAPSDEPPPLGSYITKDPDEKTAALKLVADGVAQMKQTAGRTLIFHPLNMGVFFAFAAGLIQFMRSSKGKFNDYWLIWTTMAGVLMSALITVRMFAGPYLQVAEEKVKEELVFGADVIVTKFGEEVIGTCIMIVVPTESKKNQRRKSNKAVIRGWAVRLRYRGKGVGTALLEEAAAEAKRRGCDEIEFAEDHPSMCYINSRLSCFSD